MAANDNDVPLGTLLHEDAIIKLGKNCFNSNLSFNSNPYKNGTREFRCWNLGWLGAEAHHDDMKADIDREDADYDS